MRTLAFVLLAPAMCIACAASPTSPHGDDGDDDGSGSGDPDPGQTGLEPPAHGFQIKSPTIDIKPGTEVTYCYYFQTPNTSDVSIKRWVSKMTPGSHHLILYLTPTSQQPPGTMSTDVCGISNRTTGGPVWTYSAQSVDAEASLPPDDGTGNPVGQRIPAGQFGFLQMHYLNSSDNTIRAHVELNAYAHDDGVVPTPAAPFVTYKFGFTLKPGSPALPASSMVNDSCTVPMENGKQPKFYVMSTHTHKQGVHTFIKDGATTVFDSTSWEHPGAATWNAAPFYTFTSGKLTYQCEYLNPTTATIYEGDSAKDNEMCMAIGYYFPSPAGTGHFCLNGGLVY